jgi:hypothetical protein
MMSGLCQAKLAHTAAAALEKCDCYPGTAVFRLSWSASVSFCVRHTVPSTVGVAHVFVLQAFSCADCVSPQYDYQLLKQACKADAGGNSPMCLVPGAHVDVNTERMHSRMYELVHLECGMCTCASFVGAGLASWTRS